MYKWRLLLLASFAVFQPIASFTERSLIDGRQQCCDRQPHSLHRDTRLAIYGTYRFHKTAEDRRVNNRPEILDTRRYEVKDFDSVLSLTTPRRLSRERDSSPKSLDRTSRFARVEHRRVDIRDSLRHSGRDESTYRKSVFRQTDDEIPTGIHYERRSRMSFDSERQGQVVRDNSRNFRQNNIRETRNLLPGTRNDVARDEIGIDRNSRHITRELDRYRQSYVSRPELRRQVINDRILINQRARGISTSSRNNDNNRMESKEFRENDEVVSSTLKSRSQFKRMQRRSYERESKQVFEFRPIQSTESTQVYRDERRFTNQGNRRLEPRTIPMERHIFSQSRLDVERRTLDQRNRETFETRIPSLLNTGSFDHTRNLNNIRRQLRSLNSIERPLQMTLTNTERREVSRSVRRDTAPSENRNPNRRTRGETQNNLRVEHQRTIRSSQIARSTLDVQRDFTSRSVRFNENRNKRSLDRKTRDITVLRHSIVREDIRSDLRNEASVERRYVNHAEQRKEAQELSDRTNAIRQDIIERLSMSQKVQKSTGNSKVTARNQKERRAMSESRLMESRKMDRDLMHNSMSLDRKSQRTTIRLNDVATRNQRYERSEKMTRAVSGTRLRESKHTGSYMTRDRVSLDQRSQRFTDRLRVFDVRDVRLERNDEMRNHRQYGVRSEDNTRTVSETRLTEARSHSDMAREELSLDRRSQRSIYRSRLLNFRDTLLQNNAEIRNQRQQGVRSQYDRRALSETRVMESRYRGDMAREKSSLNRRPMSRLTQSKRMDSNMARDELSFDRRSQRSIDRSRELNFREIRLQNNVEITNQKQQGVRSQDDRRAPSETRVTESGNRFDAARERFSLDRKVQRSSDRSRVFVIRLMEDRSMEYRQKQADTERPILNLRSRLNMGETTRNRNSFTTAIEEEPKLNSLILNWQHLFYTLQGIYLFGVILQIMTESSSENKNVRSFRFWAASSRNAVKID